jgi:hypothetical protein
MKTISKQWPLLFLVLNSIYFFSCTSEKTAETKLNDNEKNLNTLAVLLPKEDSIDLKDNPVSMDYGDSLRDIFKADILVNNSKKLAEIGDAIDTRAFSKLKTLAINLQNNYSKNYILGIAITYGLNSSLNKIKLLYKPVFLQNISNEESLQVDAKYTPVLGQKFYQYSSTGDTFVLVSNQDAAKAISNYTNNITFNENSNTVGYRKYINSNDSTGDIKYVFYPFQEIEAIIKDHGASMIYFFNIGQTFRANYMDSLRHNLLIGSDAVNKDKTLAFYGKYGNLSHLCPPSCSTVKFNIKLP